MENVNNTKEFKVWFNEKFENIDEKTHKLMFMTWVASCEIERNRAQFNKNMIIDQII